MNEWKTKCAPETDLSKSCFFWAVLTHAKLKEHGFKALISAGSMMWPMAQSDYDDTHFSYVWSPDEPQSKAALASGGMPEMHCWVQLPFEQEIVDLTTCYLKKQCETVYGKPWRAADPPDYVWCKLADLPPGVIYEPHIDAVNLVAKMVNNLWGI